MPAFKAVLACTDFHLLGWHRRFLEDTGERGELLVEGVVEAGRTISVEDVESLEVDRDGTEAAAESCSTSNICTSCKNCPSSEKKIVRLLSLKSHH